MRYINVNWKIVNMENNITKKCPMDSVSPSMIQLCHDDLTAQSFHLWHEGSLTYVHVSTNPDEQRFREEMSPRNIEKQLARQQAFKGEIADWSRVIFSEKILRGRLFRLVSYRIACFSHLRTIWRQKKNPPHVFKLLEIWSEKICPVRIDSFVNHLRALI